MNFFFQMGGQFDPETHGQFRPEYSNLELKHQIQNTLFPEGLLLDAKKREYLTKNTNVIFTCMAYLSSNSEGKEKGQISENGDLSFAVAGARLELATFGL